MQRITREAIRRMASSETVYYRGMRYYAAHAVSDVTWNENNGQYRSVVHGGNQYVVTIQVSEDGEWLYTCNCPSHVKQKGACKHVVATLLFIADYQQRENVKEHLDTRDKTAYQIIEYFQKREFRRLSPTYYHLGLRITIPSLLRKQNAKAYLSLYAGSEKMYKVTNTKKFIADYYEEKDIRLGKQFYFIPGECAFDEASANVMSYLTEIYEIQETLGKDLLFQSVQQTGDGLITEYAGEAFASGKGTGMPAEFVWQRRRDCADRGRTPGDFSRHEDG